MRLVVDVEETCRCEVSYCEGGVAHQLTGRQCGMIGDEAKVSSITCTDTHVVVKVGEEIDGHSPSYSAYGESDFKAAYSASYSTRGGYRYRRCLRYQKVKKVGLTARDDGKGGARVENSASSLTVKEDNDEQRLTY